MSFFYVTSNFKAWSKYLLFQWFSKFFLEKIRRSTLAVCLLQVRNMCSFFIWSIIFMQKEFQHQDKLETIYQLSNLTFTELNCQRSKLSSLSRHWTLFIKVISSGLVQMWFRLKWVKIFQEKENKWVVNNRTIRAREIRYCVTRIQSVLVIRCLCIRIWLLATARGR